MTKIASAALAALLFAGTAAQAQTWYDGTGNRHDWSRGSVEPNPMFTHPQSFYAPSLPSVPEIGSYVPAPPSGPAGYPCTLPGCR